MNLLLLRGLIRDQRCWGDFPEKLTSHAPHIKIHFLDLPGIGTENGRDSPGSIAAIRVDLAKRFHEKIAQGKLPKGPWTLFGISMGGMIALDWVNAEPDLFNKLIVVNSSSACIASVHERFNPRILPQIFRALLDMKPETSEKIILQISSNRFLNQDPKIHEFLEHQIKWRKERPITRLTFIRQILAASAYRLPPNRPKPKTMIFSSQGDRLVSPKCSQRLAERLAVHRITHPWAGHDLPLDDPEWLARECTEWMNSPV